MPEAEVTTVDLAAILASLATKDKSTELERFVKISFSKKEGAKIALTGDGKRIDELYKRTFELAEQKGPNDRDVVAQMQAMTKEWPSYPGVIENEINEAVESSDTEKAKTIAATAADQWGTLIKKAGIKDPATFDHSVAENHLFVQVLANYEFALERTGDLERALEIARLAIAIEPSDPENLVSSIISLAVRAGRPEEALDELSHMPDSVAPFVLYGRALAYHALNQIENAATAVQTALGYWPGVAQGLLRAWKGGTPMPKPGEAVSEIQVLFGYHEVFGAAWAAVNGALDWLRNAEKIFVQSGARREQYVGLTRSGMKADAHGNLQATKPTNPERLLSAKEIASDNFNRLLLLDGREYIYELTEAGKAQEEKLQDIFKQDLKYHARMDKLRLLTEEWPGHANAAVGLARFYVSEKKLDKAVDLLQSAIFAAQALWPDDLVGKGVIEVDWEGNKPLLTAYAHIILDSAELGERDTAREFARDFLAINPKDQLGVGQKAIELALLDGDISSATAIIDSASDPISAHNLFGKALALYAGDKKEEATKVLHNAVQSRPKIYREFVSDKHRMPPNYNPTFVAYFSNEEAYNYHHLWNNLWRTTLGALAWLKKEGKLAAQQTA